MNLVGQKIKHKAYGVGTVIEMEDAGHITIEFPVKTSTFQYPQAFESYLTAEDDKLQEEIIRELQTKKDAEAAEKAAKAAAAEEAARLAREAEQASKKGSYSEKKYVPVKREEGKALTFLVFQGGTFAEESKSQSIWAPIYTAAGTTVFYWESLMNVREGDVILHCADGYIKAVSRAKGSYYDCDRPEYFMEDAEKLPDPNLYKHGRKVDLEYTILGTPIRTADYRDSILDYCRVKYAPFDKDGNGNMGYLYDMDSRLASVFLQAAAEKNPELKELDYIHWLL